MTNEIETRYLLVTLPDTTGEDADEIAAILETELHGVEFEWKANGTITHAPELWVLMIDGPEFDRSVVKATEEECWEYLRTYLADEHQRTVPANFQAINAAVNDLGYIYDITRHDYPVHLWAGPDV